MKIRDIYFLKFKTIINLISNSLKDVQMNEFLDMLAAWFRLAKKDSFHIIFYFQPGIAVAAEQLQDIFRLKKTKIETYF